jgi:hypothetical protein
MTNVAHSNRKIDSLFEMPLVVHGLLHRISLFDGCFSSRSKCEIQSMSLMPMNNQFESFCSEKISSKMNLRTALLRGKASSDVFIFFPGLDQRLFVLTSVATGLMGDDESGVRRKREENMRMPTGNATDILSSCSIRLII